MIPFARVLGAAAIGAAAVVLSACGTTKSKEEAWDVVDFKGRYKAEFPARSRAAAWQESGPPSEEQGYAELGSLSVHHTEERCFKKDCSRKSYYSSPTERLLSEAAKRGGDVVVIKADNRRGSGRAIKRVCVATTTRMVPRQKCNTEMTCSGSYCSTRTTYCTTEYVSQEVCSRTEPVHGTRKYVHASGVVYRLDRDLVLQTRHGEEFAAALKGGNTGRARELVKAGMRPDSYDLRGRLPLLLAVQSGSDETVELVLTHKADPNTEDGRAMLEAVDGGHARMLAMMLEKGGDPNAGRGMWAQLKAKTYEEKRMAKGMLLKAAVQKKSLEMASMLLEKGADPTEPDHEPLQIAVHQANREMVDLLLKHGARASGDGVLAEAARSGDPALVELMLERGARVDSDAFIAAVRSRHAKVAKLLIERGADVNDRSFGERKTALIQAVENTDVEMVRLLLEAKADVNATDAPSGLGFVGSMLGEKYRTALGHARWKLVYTREPKHRAQVQSIIDLLVAAGGKG